MVGVEFLLLGALDRRAVLEYAQGREGLQEAHLVLVDADRIEDAHVERAHLDVLDARPAQRPGRPLARPGGPLRADEAVVLVLDLQHVGVQLPPLAVDFDPQALVLGARREDQRLEVAGVVLQGIHRDREVRLAAVAVAEVAHAQGRGVRRIEGVRIERTEAGRHRPTLEEAATDRRRCAEQVQDQPAVPPVVAQQREIRFVDECLARAARLAGQLQRRPEALREGVVEVHPRDRLHHPPVAQPQAATIDVLHAADVRTAVLGQRDARVAIERAGHAGGPQQFVINVPVGELVQVQQVLQQLPGLGHRRCDQFEQGLGVVGRDLRIGQRRAERCRVRRRGNAAPRRDPQRFLFDALATAAQDAALAGVDQPRQPALEDAIDARGRHGKPSPAAQPMDGLRGGAAAQPEVDGMSGPGAN